MKIVEIKAYGVEGVALRYLVICEDVELDLPDNGVGLAVFHFEEASYVEFSEQGGEPVRRGKLETLGFRSLTSFEVVEVNAEEAAANTAG